MLANGPFKFEKQLFWQTGLELCSTRNAKVNFRLCVAFHSSSRRPNPHKAIGTLLVGNKRLAVLIRFALSERLQGRGSIPPINEW